MLLRASALLAAVCFVGCRGDDPSLPMPPTAVDRAAGTGSPGRLAAADDGDGWMRAAKDFSSSRFSALDQITTSNVSQLGVRLTFSTGVVAGHEAAPLVVNGTMYIVTPWPTCFTPSI